MSTISIGINPPWTREADVIAPNTIFATARQIMRTPEEANKLSQQFFWNRKTQGDG
jgi:hypothetical protein